MADQARDEEQPTRRSDGRETHREILEAAMRLASQEGLSSLSIGRLAKEVGMSKSGVFAHFRSRDRLQLETVEAAREVFTQEVLEPGLDAPEGLLRLQSLLEAYLSYVERGVFPGGCFFAQLLGEFDGRSGLIHEQVQADQETWLRLLTELIETAQDRGELEPDADPVQLAFELYAPLELANFLATLHRDPAIVERAREAVRKALEARRSRS